MNDILFSIIIPVYNGEKYIEKCLKSIMHQAFSDYDYEIIIINDGSTDKTLKIIKRLIKNKKQFKVISQENKGGIVARRKGIDVAHGKYIGFMDVDDWYPNKNVFLRFAQMINESNADLIQYNHYKCRRSTIYLKENTQSKPLTVEHRAFIEIHFPSLLGAYYDGQLKRNVWSKLYINHILKDLPFEMGKGFMGDDVRMNIYALENVQKAAFYQEKLYCYRAYSGATNKFNKNFLFDYQELKRLQSSFIDQLLSKGYNLPESIETDMHIETAYSSVNHYCDAYYYHKNDLNFNESDIRMHIFSFDYILNAKSYLQNNIQHLTVPAHVMEMLNTFFSDDENIWKFYADNHKPQKGLTGKIIKKIKSILNL